MLMSKKGISPLIATVLIMGFTIVLAALVISWGGDLFKGFQEDTGKSAETSTQCSYLLSDVSIAKFGEVALYDQGIATVLVQNENAQEIKIVGVKLKVTDQDGTAETSEKVKVEGDIPAMSSKSVVAEGLTTPYQTAVSVSAFVYIPLADGEEAMCPTEIGTIKISA